MPAVQQASQTRDGGAQALLQLQPKRVAAAGPAADGSAAPAAASMGTHPHATSSAALLPYGPTLHYPGCSCPPAWQRGGRAADQVDALVTRVYGLYAQGLIAPQRKLRVCYMLPHHNITGVCMVEWRGAAVRGRGVCALHPVLRARRWQRHFAARYNNLALSHAGAPPQRRQAA
jgi:hypothetical protein